MKATFFAAQEDFRKWLTQHHQMETELLVGYHKVHSNKPSMTWPESVDQALCFGWIDGVRKSIDAESYCIRFTPRRKNSIWSAINIQKVEMLIKAGLMTPKGLEAYGFRKENKSQIYSYEKEADQLDAAYEKQFKKNKIAWNYFQAQPAYYKKQMIHRIMDAKQEKTQIKRLEKLVLESSLNRRCP